MSLPVLALLLASAMWGLSWLPLKFLYSAGFGGVSLIVINFGLLALLLTPVLFHQRRSWWPHKKKLFLIAILGGIANVSFAYSLIYGDVVRVMVLFYLLPIWGVLGGRILLRETVDFWRWLGVVLAIGGAFIVLGGAQLLKTPPSWIDLVAISSGFALAMTNLAFRAVQEVPVASKVIVTFYGCFVLAACILLLMAEPFTAGASSQAWGALLAYVFLWLMVASFTSQWAVTQIESGRSSIIIIVELLAAVVSATLIRGEVLTVAEMTGGVFILAAALIEALRDMKSHSILPVLED